MPGDGVNSTTNVPPSHSVDSANRRLDLGTRPFGRNRAYLPTPLLVALGHTCKLGDPKPLGLNVAARRKQSGKARYRQDVEQLSDNLKWYREQTQITQVMLAHRTGLYRTYFSLIERKLFNPSVRILTIIAAGLGIKPQQLLQKRLLPTTRRAGQALRPLTRSAIQKHIQRARERLAAGVKQRRLRSRLSQMAFAKETRTHYTFISLIERRRANPSLLIVSRIAAAINIKTDQLF
jgi:transcriptional regulator with XRE-family HTH domain